MRYNKETSSLLQHQRDRTCEHSAHDNEHALGSKLRSHGTAAVAARAAGRAGARRRRGARARRRIRTCASCGERLHVVDLPVRIVVVRCRADEVRAQAHVRACRVEDGRGACEHTADVDIKDNLLRYKECARVAGFGGIRCTRRRPRGRVGRVVLEVTRDGRCLRSRSASVPLREAFCL